MAKPLFDVVSPRDRGDGRTHWHTIGAAWPRNDGYTIELNSLPLPNSEGKVTLMLFPIKEEKFITPEKSGPIFDSDIDDDVPF